MHWIYPSVGGALFAFGLGAISDAAFTLVIDSYQPVRSATQRTNYPQQCRTPLTCDSSLPRPSLVLPLSATLLLFPSPLQLFHG